MFETISVSIYFLYIDSSLLVDIPINLDSFDINSSLELSSSIVFIYLKLSIINVLFCTKVLLLSFIVTTESSILGFCPSDILGVLLFSNFIKARLFSFDRVIIPSIL